MPVLANNVSVIVKAAAVDAKYPGGREAFRIQCGESYCDDGELARVGFPSLQQATEFVCALADRGLSPYNSRTGFAEDMIVASEDRGLAIRCDWAEFGLFDLNGNPAVRVPACRALGTDSVELAIPSEWCQDESARSRNSALATLAKAGAFLQA